MSNHLKEWNYNQSYSVLNTKSKAVSEIINRGGQVQTLRKLCGSCLLAGMKVELNS